MWPIKTKMQKSTTWHHKLRRILLCIFVYCAAIIVVRTGKPDRQNENDVPSSPFLYPAIAACLRATYKYGTCFGLPPADRGLIK